MRTFVLLIFLTFALVAASVAPDNTLSLLARELPSLIPADGVDAETTQCLATCAQQVAAAHQTEFQNCAAQTTIEAQQACVCASDFFDENKKCIPQCFKDEHANEAAEDMEAACSQLSTQNGGVTPTAGSENNSTNGKPDKGSNSNASNGAAGMLRAQGGLFVMISGALLIVY